MHDFDILIDRRYTSSLKWDRYGDRDIIPLWVADMDFAAPPAVLAAIHERVNHGVLGYTKVPRELTDILVEYLSSNFRWDVSRESIVYLPGLVCGLHVAARSVGSVGDEQVIFTPIYPPFFNASTSAGRILREVPLLQDPKSLEWTIDFKMLQSVVSPRTRLLLLCNPHNPVGRVFSYTELSRLAEFCVARDITICSDEIHNGLLLDPIARHIPIATMNEATAQKTITLMAPSKTYNIPGLACSFAIIQNREIRKAFTDVMNGIVPHVNVLGYAATIAAYRDSQEWLDDLLDYLRVNRDLVMDTLSRIPRITISKVEATYLAWIDVRALQLENGTKFFENAGVGLSDGAEFGAPGFVRLNFACRRELLQNALLRITNAIAGT